MIDHTQPEPTDVATLAVEAQELGAQSVCVSPSMPPLVGDGVIVATVCGVPSGHCVTAVKVAPAQP